jgi:hypothetical protein
MARTSRIARTNRFWPAARCDWRLGTLEPVFWLRTVMSARANSPEPANAFPSHRDSGIWRTTNVHHSGASAADSHRLPNTIALIRAMAGVQPLEGWRKITARLNECKMPPPIRLR